MNSLHAMYLLFGLNWGIVVHPGGDPNLAVWTDRPPQAVVGRWGENASCVVVSSRCVITTRHQGTGMGVPVVIDGRTYGIRRLWLHDLADLCIAELEGARFQHSVGVLEGSGETGSLVVIAGYGNGRGAQLETSGIVYGYSYDHLANTTLRFGTNRIDRIISRTENQDTLVADFDRLFLPGSTSYECIPAQYDSGGGWFLSKGSGWKLAGLSQRVEAHYEEGHENDPQYLIPYEAWFARKSAPLVPDPDQFEAVRLLPYRGWIQSILNQVHRADLNQDGVVDLQDFALFAAFWAHCDCPLVSDCMGADREPDGDVDLDDLASLVQYWTR